MISMYQGILFYAVLTNQLNFSFLDFRTAIDMHHCSSGHFTSLRWLNSTWHHQPGNSAAPTRPRTTQVRGPTVQHGGTAMPKCNSSLNYFQFNCYVVGQSRYRPIKLVFHLNDRWDSLLAAAPGVFRAQFMSPGYASYNHCCVWVCARSSREVCI